MKNALQILEEAFLGKKIKGFGFGNESPEREAAIGQVITKVSFGFNDSREDAGMLIYFKIDGYTSCPVFVYDIETIEVGE